MEQVGPDKTDIWVNGPIGIAVAANNVGLDVREVSQPLCLQNRYWAAGDVRLDGRAEYLRRLKSGGVHAGPEDADVELVLAGWGRWGEQVLDYLIGDFTFVIWDSLLQQLFCVRDQVGVSQLYYARVDGMLVFTNIFASLQEFDIGRQGLDDHAATDFLVFGFLTDTSRTAYKSVRQVPPAHTLTASLGEVRLKRYWQLPVEPLLNYRRKEEYLEHFQELLRTTIVDRLDSDRVAVSMSGGMDSTSVCALISEATDDRCALRAVTESMKSIPGSANEDALFAAMVAEKLNIPIEYVDPALDDSRYTELLHKWTTPAPSMMIVPSRFLLLCDRMLAHARLGFTGHGGDILGAYDTGYLKQYLSAGRFDLLFRDLYWHYRDHNALPRFGIRSAIKRRFENAPLSKPLPPWVRAEVVERFSVRARWAEWQRMNDPGRSGPEESANPRMYSQYAGYGWPPVLQEYHPSMTGLPLMFRHPYFDIRLQRFMLRLPSLPWVQSKHILRRSMAGRLPGSVVTRPNTPVDISPYSEYLKHTSFGLENALLEGDSSALLGRYVRIDKLKLLMGGASSLRMEETEWLRLPFGLLRWVSSSKIH